MPFIDLSNTTNPVVPATPVPATPVLATPVPAPTNPVSSPVIQPTPPVVATTPIKEEISPEPAPEFENHNAVAAEMLPDLANKPLELDTATITASPLVPGGLKSSNPVPTPEPIVAAVSPVLPVDQVLSADAPGLALADKTEEVSINPSLVTPTLDNTVKPEEEDENDLADLPVSELNSLNIPERLTNNSALVQNQPKVNDKQVELTVDSEGVKTITGPALPEIQPKVPEAVPAENLVADPVPVVAVTDTIEAPVPTVTTTATSEVHYAGGILPSDTKMDTLMQIAEQQQASDIHFTANYPVMLRIHGKLVDLTEPLSVAQAKDLSDQLLTDARKEIFAKDLELDFSFTSTTNTRFRVNLFTERGNAAGALRLIAKDIRSMADLELPDIFKDIVEEPHGLVLLVGPTGSGKSTTLAAMINYINLNRSEHIVTIEDPIEYVYPVGKSIVNQRELSADTQSWGAALKSALREDPNVVLVGEMRDLSTIESTITIAETGHLTFATLHTNSAAQAVDRIIDVFPEGAKEQIRAQLANVITAVVSQRLIPVQTGGRKAALEVMLGTVAVRNAIREGKTYQIDNIIQTSGDLGMITLEKSLVELVNKGAIDRDTAKMYTSKPDEIDSLLNKPLS